MKLNIKLLHAHSLYTVQNPAKASEATVKETSTPETLTAAQVSISITIVANLTNEVLNNNEVAVIVIA